MSAINLSSSYSQNFDALISSGSGNWVNDPAVDGALGLSGWYTARTGTGTTLVAGTGSSNTGALYSFGNTGDRALGAVGSSNALAGNFFWGVRLVNNTANPISELDIDYVGEQWRNGGGTGLAQTVDFQYQVGATSLTTGTWVDFNVLDFTSPVFSTTAGALDGNLAANQTALTATLGGLSLAPGQEIWLRWSDIDHASSDHGLAIDNFSVSAVVADPVINEFVFSHTGTDNTEYVEILGGANTSYSTLSLLQIEGDTTAGPGVIDTVISVGTTDANGFWTTGFLTNVFENDNVTLLLVENFTGAQGDDLDTNNDGVLDSTPWGRIVDAIAVRDTGVGGQTYANVALQNGFDSVSFEPGGASRIPNGTDTNTVADWVRNDFDLAGIGTGTPVVGEALNTPGAVNAVVAGTPLVSIQATDNSAIESGADPGTFRISRTGSTAAALTVDYTVGGTATNGTDYTPNLTGTANIGIGQSFVDITITPVNDGISEGNETAVLTLTDTTANYDLGTTIAATVTIADAAVSLTPIYQIQGPGHTSPFVTVDFNNLPANTFNITGTTVTTSGIVTAVDTNGFYLQDPTGDGDIRTSDAIFVFTSTAPTVTVGNSVQVAGTVAEFFPGNTSTRNLPITEIITPTVTVLATGQALPAAVILGAGGRVPPTENIDNDAFASFDATTDGIDFFESLESMLVTAQNAVAVSGTNGFGEIFAVVDGGAGATGLSQRGTLNISPNDFNPERIQIDEDTGILPGFTLPQVATGAQLGNVTGVISYDFGNFQIQPTQVFTATPSTLQAEVTTLAGNADQLTIASYNVLNLDPNDADGDTDVADGRFVAIANQIINNLNTPDIIGLQEIQDNNGSTNDSVTAANVTLQTLVDAIVAAGGPQYQFIDNPFVVDDQVGGQPGGNIRTAFLYDPSRVSLVAGSVKTVAAADQPAFAGSRLPLAADFTFNGETVTVVSNHFSSKGGSAPILGIRQPFEALQEDLTVNGSLNERQAQAQAVKNFADSILTADATANVVVLGDLNEFEFVSPLQTLEQSLTNLTETLPENERYTFNFQGNSQSLDHILVSNSLAAGSVFDIVHVNNEFAETPQRASDHDPLLVSLTLPEPINIINGTSGRDQLTGGDGRDRITGSTGADILIGGAGNDEFVYTSIRDAGDRIVDFTLGEDKIDLSLLLDSLGYTGSDPFLDGYIRVVGSGTVNLEVDANGPATASFRTYVTIQGPDLTAANVGVASNFIF